MPEERPPPRPATAHPAICPLLQNSRAVSDWTACCAKYFRPAAARIAGDASLAEDALQESWLRILRALPRFRGGPTACLWVRRIVINCARDIQRRSLRRRGEISLNEARTPAAAGTNPEDRATEQELLRVLRETMALLPEPYREVLELRFERELSTYEAAKRLKVTRSNVATRLHRALGLLKRRFRSRLRQQAQPSPCSSRQLKP